MNKPIRRVAFIALMMFALLLANGTYMMIFRQDALALSRRTGECGTPNLRRTGGDLGRRKVEMAKTVPSKDRFKYQRVYPDGELYARSPASTPTTAPALAWRAHTTPNLPVTDDALFVRRLIDMATNKTPKGRRYRPRLFPRFKRRRPSARQPEGGCCCASIPSQAQCWRW
jgi:peptidoglycan glycosyltransferase